MKNTIQILLAAVLLAFNFCAFAQDGDKHDEPVKKKKSHAKSFIEVSAGYSVPVGQFTKTDYSDLRSGFGGAGPVFAISGAKYIGHSNFGIGGTLSYAYYNMRGL
jgi:hypothetical protein